MPSFPVIADANQSLHVDQVVNNRLFSRNRKRKCSLSAFTVKLIGAADFVPGFSFITNVIAICLKCILYKNIKKLSEKSLYLRSIQKKSIATCLVLCIPIFGNGYKIAICVTKRHIKKQLENMSEEPLHRVEVSLSRSSPAILQREGQPDREAANEEARLDRDRAACHQALNQSLERSRQALQNHNALSQAYNQQEEANLAAGLEVLNAALNCRENLITSTQCSLDALIVECARCRSLINRPAARQGRQVVRQGTTQFIGISRNIVNDIINCNALISNPSIATKVDQLNRSLREIEVLVARF